MLLAASLAVVPLALLSHAGSRHAAASAVRSRRRGRRLIDLVLLIIALVGTTVAPWQLFFQQSNVVDKRITPRWLAYERVDTLDRHRPARRRRRRRLLACAWAFGGTPLHGAFSDAGAVAHGLRGDRLAAGRHALRGRCCSTPRCSAPRRSRSPAPTPSATYFGYKHSLHRGWRDATVFHGIYAGSRRRRRGRRAHPRRAARTHHHRRPGARRRPAAERDRLPAAAVQRPRRCSGRGSTRAG